MKRAAETLNFLTEHGISSYEELAERCDGAAAATYRQLRPMYDQYRQSRDKEKFLRGHEGEIILFEATARELKRLDAVPLPATQRLRAEMDELTTRRTALQTELRKIQKEEKEYDMIQKKNIDILLSNQNKRSKTKDHEIE